MKNTITKTALFNAVATALYIILIASFLFYAPKLFGPPRPDDNKTPLIPVVMLSLLVFSAATTGSLIFGRPILWYLDGKKKEAVQLLFSTLGIFLIITLVAISVLYLVSMGSADYKSATYLIDGEKITLASEGIKYFGNEVRHDLNGDGREDVAFLLTRQTGGSGTFFYIVAALNVPNGYAGSEAFFLGDRIAPQTTEIDEGLTARGTKRQNVIVVNYADRLPNEPFTAKPSVGKSVWLKLDPATLQFGEVAQNFEGESR